MQLLQDTPLCNSTGTIITFAFVYEHQDRCAIKFNCDLYIETHSLYLIICVTCFTLFLAHHIVIYISHLISLSLVSLVLYERKKHKNNMRQACSARRQRKSWLYSVEEHLTQQPNKSCGKLEHQNMLISESTYFF